MRKSQGRVAETALADPGRVLSATLAELSQSAQVSEPKAIRFATAIGCDGFRDLRIKMARSLAFGRATSHSAIDESDDLGPLAGKILDFDLSNLNWGNARLDHGTLAAAVTMPRRADRVLRLRRLGDRGDGRPAEVPADRGALRGGARRASDADDGHDAGAGRRGGGDIQYR